MHMSLWVYVTIKETVQQFSFKRHRLLTRVHESVLVLQKLALIVFLSIKAALTLPHLVTNSRNLEKVMSPYPMRRVAALLVLITAYDAPHPIFRPLLQQRFMALVNQGLVKYPIALIRWVDSQHHAVYRLLALFLSS